MKFETLLVCSWRVMEVLLNTAHEVSYLCYPYLSTDDLIHRHCPVILYWYGITASL